MRIEKPRADKLYQRQKINEIGAIMNDREKCLREACEIAAKFNGGRDESERADIGKVD